VHQADPRPAVGQLAVGAVDLAPGLEQLTREFLAGVTIAEQFGRPHTLQDQAWIETLFGHAKGEWPHLEKIRDPASPAPSWTASGRSTTPSGCTPAPTTSAPTTGTKAEVMPSARPAATGSPRLARTASHTVEPQPGSVKLTV